MKTSFKIFLVFAMVFGGYFVATQPQEKTLEVIGNTQEWLVNNFTTLTPENVGLGLFVIVTIIILSCKKKKKY